MSNLYQRMTQTLSLHMGDTILVREQFQEAIVRIAELEGEAKKWKQITCDWQDTNSELEKEVEATRQNADHWMSRKEECERALAESERISKSWKAQWKAMLQDERKEKSLRCSLQDSLSEIREVLEALQRDNAALRRSLTQINEMWMGDSYVPSDVSVETYLKTLLRQCYEVSAGALKT